MAEQTTTTRGGAATISEPVARLAAATASQLRLVADSHADAAPAARAGRLGEVVREALERVETPQRAAFLVALEQHFPTWDADPTSAGAIRDAPAPAEAPSRREYVDTELLNDPGFLVRKLTELAPKLTFTQRQTIGAALAKLFPPPAAPKPTPAPTPAAPPVAASQESPAAAPVVPVAKPQAAKPAAAATGIAAGEGATQLQQATGLARHAVDPERMAGALALLFDLCCSIDDAAWGVWEHLITRGGLETNVKRKAVLKPTLTRMLTGDPLILPANVAPAVRDLRGLAVGLVTAAGDNVKRTNDTVNRLNPDAIEDSVPKKSVDAWRRAACWDAYRKRFAESSASIQQGVANELKTAVEFYVRGTGT
jgi:hypothetical protein